MDTHSNTFIRVYHFNLFLFLVLSPTSFTPISARQKITPLHSIPLRIPYSQHCGQILAESIPTSNPYFTTQIPTFYNAYVTNGDQILGSNSQSIANLNPRNVFKTISNGVYKFDALLGLRVDRFYYREKRNLLKVHGGPRFPRFPRPVRFQLSGFWDSASGQLCMVGSGTKRGVTGNFLQFDVVFKSIYPNTSVITSSLVTGSLESLNPEGSESYFRPISIMGFSRMNYDYTLIKEEVEVGSESDNNSLANVGGRFRNCYHFSRLSDNFELGYRSSCDGRNCSWLDGLLGFLPRYMSLNEIDCSSAKMMRVSFGVSDTSDIRHGYRELLDPRRTLVAEGAWNSGRTQLHFIACRILNFTDSSMKASIGDCSIRVNFTFPASLTIRTSVINGQISSNKSVNEPGYFDSSEIRAAGSRRAALPDMKYEYTEIERAKKYCDKKKVTNHKGKSYPDPYSLDMKFDMDVRNSKGEEARGKAHPVFIGDRFVEDTYPYPYQRRPSLIPILNSTFQPHESLKGLVNLTYQISFSPKDKLKVGGRSLTSNKTILISSEGTYDMESGHLCMVGCWNRETDGNVPLNMSLLDCDISINIQFPPRGSNGGNTVKGTIESKRENIDPLYFEHLDLASTSLTVTQVENVFWRMDFEITMVLISNTLACIFVGLQLFHAKKHPDALPFISIVMLVVITLGHMIPLLLNMEAFFLSSPSKRTVIFGSGGWLEVNEVLVRVITMVAFLLEFRLLQLTWSSRGDDETRKTLWVAEKKVICYSLPLYVGGALIVWFVQRLRGSNPSPFRATHLNPRWSPNPFLPFWRDVKSYAGFVLDAFLLPQIMFNIFSDSKERALCLPYYVGTTIVRLLPHGYDLFRVHSSSWKYDPWYIYADPGMNYYSTTWDIIISCLGLVFVILVYVQQKFGGWSIIPRRFKESVEYEKVPVGL